jgi:aspartate aminotransferase
MSDIDNLRNKMDEITLNMISLFKSRIDVAKQIGQIKHNIGKGVTDEQREDNLRNKVISLCKELDLDISLGTKFLNFLLNESVRVQSKGKQTHLSIFLKAKSLEEQGRDIIHMEVGEPDLFPPHIVKTSLTQVFDKGFLRYGPVKGIPQFRKALAQYTSENFAHNKTNITPDNILVSPGARFSIFLTISSLLNPGDEIIIIEPAWPAYRDCALYAGAKVKSIPTTLKEGWEPSIQKIQKLITQNTKMLVLNYPNNPTGKILKPKTQDDIVNLAIKNDLYILSDEIYWQHAYHTTWKSILQYNYNKTIVAQSFSKSHAMTGFRIGYAIADPTIIEKMAHLQALCLTNVSEPIQYVAMQALKADLQENHAIIKSRLDILSKKAQEIGLDFVKPDGAMYLFARLKKDDSPNMMISHNGTINHDAPSPNVFDSTKFANTLLSEYGLAVAPGNGFGNYGDFIRLSACIDEKTLIKGMNILDNAIRRENITKEQ